MSSTHCWTFLTPSFLTFATDQECTGWKCNKMENQELKNAEKDSKNKSKRLVWMERLVQYCSLGFDQRQEKARKPRVRQLGQASWQEGVGGGGESGSGWRGKRGGAQCQFDRVGGVCV